MILRVGSNNIQTFKEVTFKQGLNLVLADKADQSTDRDTRNGVGKTLLIDIIHFCLGGSFEKDGPLSRLVETEARFFVEVIVENNVVAISRDVKRDSPVFVLGLPGQWLSGHKYEQSLLDDSIKMKSSVLNDILGEHWFGLPVPSAGKYSPSFRALFGFIARNGKGAFLDQFETFSQMPAWQKQVLNTYLLRLGWEYAVRWQEWKDKSERYTATKKAVESGLLPGFNTPGELESEVNRLRGQHGRVKRDLDNFKVLEEYEDIKRRSNRLTREMQERQNDNIADADLLRMYEANLQVESDTEPEKLIRLYDEAGVVLADSVQRSLVEVMQFHKELVANRQNFLMQEIVSIRKRVSKREVENREADAEKSRILNTLKTSGALDEFTALQNLNAELDSKIHSIQDRIDSLIKLDETRTVIDEERVDLEKATKADHLDRKPLRTESLGVFDEYVRALYECNGDLIIDVEKAGFRFSSKVVRDDAEVIGKMKIFCYDLMIARIWTQAASGPQFLIHDTTLFDGVEERQRGHALELALRESESVGFQYISFLNSDFIPNEEYLGSVRISDHVVLRLDDTEEGSLLGFRF